VNLRAPFAVRNVVDNDVTVALAVNLAVFSLLPS